MISERHQHLRQALKRVWDLYGAAAEDRRAVHGLLRAWPDDKVTASHPDSFAFLVRSLVRTFFAEIEAMSSAFAASLLELDERGIVNLSIGERVILAEKSYILTDGKLKERQSSNPFLENFRFRYNRFSAAWGVELVLAVGDHRWGSFRKALVMRHSITHPKGVADFHVSQDSVRHLCDAISWFSDQASALFASCEAVLGEPLEKTRGASAEGD